MLNDSFGCKICGKQSLNKREHNKHINKTHSISAISLAKEVVIQNSRMPRNLKGCTKCGRNFFFTDTLLLHVQKCHMSNSNLVENPVQIDRVKESTDMSSRVLEDVLENAFKNIFIKEEIKVECEGSNEGEDKQINNVHCTKCEKTFPYTQSLKAHMTKYHDDFKSIVITIEIVDEILENVVKNKFAEEEIKTPRIGSSEKSIIIIGGGDDESFIEVGSDSESDENAEESDSASVKREPTESKTVNSLYAEKQWGDDDDSPDPSGINYKSKLSAFKKSIDKLKKFLRKGSIRQIGETKAHVEEVKRKGTGTEVRVKIKDPEGEGEVMLRIWGPNKKTKETTVQINSTKGNDERLVKKFAEVYVKEIIDRDSNGRSVEDMFEQQEAKVSCTVCEKKFAKQTTLNLHMKSHMECKRCGKGFKSEQELERHKLLTHRTQQKGASVESNKDNFTEACEDCEYIASSRKSLMIHKENKHIEDSWLVSTKRESNMMNSEKEHIKTKTEEQKKRE